MPLYYLFKIESNINRTKAYQLATIIKNKKVKIPSWTIDNIKQEQYHIYKNKNLIYKIWNSI
jgi:hypothetical protein